MCVLQPSSNFCHFFYVFTSFKTQYYISLLGNGCNVTYVQHFIHYCRQARIKRDLLKHDVFLEEFGGEVQSIEISALKGEGLEALEEAIHAQAELCDIRGDPEGQVQGTVIESKLDKGLG